MRLLGIRRSKSPTPMWWAGWIMMVLSGSAAPSPRRPLPTTSASQDEIPPACEAKPGLSIFQGGTVAAYANVSSAAACCALCGGDFKDECAGWEWVNLTVVRADHDCDIMAKIGNPANFPGRVSGIVAARPSVGFSI